MPTACFSPTKMPRPSEDLPPLERLRLLQIYDSPEFVQSYGARPQSLEIQPVERFLDQTGIPIDTIKDWCQQALEAHPLDSGAIDGVNTIGNCKLVSIYRPPDSAPVFLLNAHLYSILDSYESPGSSLCTLHLKPAGSKAPSGKSLRRELEKVWTSPYRMSRSALESTRDLWLWFGVEPQDTVTGRELFGETGINPGDLETQPYIDYLGQRWVLVELAAGLSIDQTRAILAGGTLAETPAPAASAATLQRLDLAYEEARMISQDPGVQCVIATGSIARNRCSDDSDLDLAIIVDDSHGPRRIDSRQIGDVVLDRDWIPASEAHQLVSQSPADVKRLRESSRIGLGLVLYDPAGMSKTLRQESIQQLPDKEDVQQRLIVLLGTLSEMIEDPQNARGTWEIFRSIYDNLAFITLLLHPLRYQKAKWVPADLRYTGSNLILQGLLEAYGVDESEETARQTIQWSRQFLELLATVLGLPRYQQTIALGNTSEFAEFSYACRCHADSISLFRDGLLLDAQYTAKFSVRLGLGMAQIQQEGTELEPLELLQKTREDRLSQTYRRIFELDTRPQPGEAALAECFEAAEVCRQAYQRRFEPAFAEGKNPTPAGIGSR